METKKTHCVSIWGNAMSITDRTAATYAKDISFRYPVFIPFDGKNLRFTFDNFCGTDDVTITAACIAYNGVNFPIQFGGCESVKISAKEHVISDMVPLSVKKEDKITVSFYCKELTELRSGVVAMGPLSKGQFSYGNHITEEKFPLDLTRNTTTYYFLSDVTMESAQENRAVICYGDSITAQNWPDELALLLAKNNKALSSVRKAASGTRILRQYDCITYQSYGLCAKVRFPHEIPMVQGAKAIIIQQGINDIIHPVGSEVNPFRPWNELPTAEELIEGLKYYIVEARKYGLKVYMGTLLPIKGWRTYASFRDELRCKVNEFIRTTNLIDGFIDFDEAVRDENDPAAFALECNSGDSLHPSALAYQKMAQAAYEVIKDI